MVEYTENFMLNKSFKPIEIFLKYQNRIIEEKRVVNKIRNVLPGLKHVLHRMLTLN